MESSEGPRNISLKQCDDARGVRAADCELLSGPGDGHESIWRASLAPFDLPGYLGASIGIWIGSLVARLPLGCAGLGGRNLETCSTLLGLRRIWDLVCKIRSFSAQGTRVALHQALSDMVALELARRYGCLTKGISLEDYSLEG